MFRPNRKRKRGHLSVNQNSSYAWRSCVLSFKDKQGFSKVIEFWQELVFKEIPALDDIAALPLHNVFVSQHGAEVQYEPQTKSMSKCCPTAVREHETQSLLSFTVSPHVVEMIPGLAVSNKVISNMDFACSRHGTETCHCLISYSC